MTENQTTENRTFLNGRDLKTWRQRHGYATQEALRKELGIKSRDTISRWENAAGPLPRQLELALIALAEVPTCRNWGATHRETPRPRPQAEWNEAEE